MGNTWSEMVSRLYGEKDMRILVVGLDAAGKTTILHKLEIGEIVTTIPTVGFNVETVEYKKLTFISWDFGGPEKNRPYWESYGAEGFIARAFLDFQNTQGVIFVVDSNDRERIPQAREELQHMMKEEELREAPFLIFANKRDMPNAMNEDEIADKLGLYDLGERTWHIQVASATSGDGLSKGLDWLINIMN